METMSNYLEKLKSYENLEVAIIRSTKINKVLKGIIKLNSIPREEEYDFRSRAVGILGKWKSLLESDLPSAATNEDEEGASTAKPTANGVKEKESAATEGKVEDADATPDETKKNGDDGGESVGAPEKDVEMTDAPAAAQESEERPDDAVAEKTATETAAEA